MTATFDHSYFAQHGTEDDTAKARQAKEAERDHHERVAAVRVVAGLAEGVAEAREICAMLGLSDAEIREARRPVVGVASAGVGLTGARRGKVTAA